MDDQRATIEAELGEEGRRVLDWLCRELEVPRHAWQKVPPLRTVAETIAARRLAERMRDEAGGGAWTPIFAQACWRLGLSEKSVADRDARWFRDSRKAG